MTIETLATLFLMLMGLAACVYAILDGYDLGVGILLPVGRPDEADQMIASIGPFWDANETWLVLAIGILLIAFPGAYSMVFGELYLATAVLLIGLSMRGVAFDFRSKAITGQRRLWDRVFRAGSVIAAVTQGYMLGRYVLGFEDSMAAYLFAALSAVCVSAAYAYIGGAWLVMKTEGVLQRRAAGWARRAGWFAALGITAISVINPLISPQIAERWFSFPEVLLLAPVPLGCFALILAVDRYLLRVPHPNDFGCGFPFLAIVSIFSLAFIGLAYSYYPYVVPGKMLALDAVAAESSLRFVFYGTALVVPFILLYTIYSYRVFWGKTSSLRYH